MEHGPFKIRLPFEVRSDLPVIVTDGPVVAEPGVHDGYCNAHGAVYVKLAGERSLGMRPGEFEYIELPPAGIPLALTPAQVRTLADKLEEAKARIDKLGGSLMENAVEINELRDAVRPLRRTVEIVDPSGRVSYRRPAGHPIVAQARGTPGYTVRYEDDGSPVL